MARAAVGRGRPSACGGGAGLCHAKVAFVGALSPGRALAARRHLMVFNPLNPGEDRDPCANPVPEALSRPGPAEPAGPDGDSEGAGDAGFVHFPAPSEEGTQVATKAAASPRAVGGAPAAGPSPGPRLTCVPRGSHRSVGRTALWPRIRDTALWTPMLGPLQPQAVGGGEGAPQPQRPTPPTPRPPTPSWGQPIPSTALYTWGTESSV